MKRLLTLCVVFFAVSCAGPVERIPPVQVLRTVKPPAVTGSIQLVFDGMLGKKGDIRSPWGISFGVDGTLYVCDRDKSSIVRLNSEGEIISRFDSYTNRTERLYAPIDVCSSSGIEVYGVDASNSRVLRFDRNLKNGFTIYRGGTKELRLFGSFNGLAYDRISGDLYITDRDAGTVIRVDMLGGSVRSLGGFGSERKSFGEPAGLDIDADGVLYIADTENGSVAVVRKFGSTIDFIGEGVLEAPVDAAVMPDGRIAVADRNGIVILSSTGIAEAFAGFGDDREMLPRSVAFDSGKVFVSDGKSASILVYRVE
ncbi:NHL repeat-containing protein [Candidatus Omnitrophota bacterium]